MPNGEAKAQSLEENVWFLFVCLLIYLHTQTQILTLSLVALYPHQVYTPSSFSSILYILK